MHDDRVVVYLKLLERCKENDHKMINRHWIHKCPDSNTKSLTRVNHERDCLFEYSFITVRRTDRSTIDQTLRLFCRSFLLLLIPLLSLFLCLSFLRGSALPTNTRLSFYSLLSSSLISPFLLPPSNGIIVGWNLSTFSMSSISFLHRRSSNETCRFPTKNKCGYKLFPSKEGAFLDNFNALSCLYNRCLQNW